MKNREADDRDDFESILPEYGRRKLLTCAESIRELAESFQETRENREILPEESRNDFLCQRRLFENKNLMAEHLQEMAQIMTNVAQETKSCRPLSVRRVKQIAHAMKEVGVQMKNLYLIENEEGKSEVTICLRNEKRNTLSAEEMGDLLSVLLNIRLVCTGDNPFFVTEEWKTFYYVEEAGYHVLTGVATAVKETEKVSGDNYSFFEMKPGNQTAILSDGMGSGEKACQDSTLVVELMQKFLEAGFPAETAISMINSALVCREESANMSTLDLCSIDLYGGECRFIKVGSACSYIKRGQLVERISSGNLPMGIFQKPDVDMVCRELEDGDYVILFSDGVTDALSQGMGEEILPEVIGSCQLSNPGEIAGSLLNFCIHQCKGRIRDDMTILVIGIWKKEEE
mgnify:FL=1